MAWRVSSNLAGGRILKQKIAIIGAGSWGTALAVSLSGKGHEVSIWDLDDGLLRELDADRENRRYLPGVPFGDGMKASFSLNEALYGADIALFTVPSQHFRGALESAVRLIGSETPIVNAAKGIEQKSLRTLSQIAAETAPGSRYAVISGPSHAEEVGRALPTTVVAASEDNELAEYVQTVFMTGRLRVYTNSDVRGVELGGALKNIIALGAGISDGMGFGDNAKAAMMTRGINEMARLGERLGGRRETFFGLSGIGDLIVTCTSEHSRNRRCGVMIGEGVSPDEATRRVGMVVEGMYTTEAAWQLARRTGVEMPITDQIYRVITGQASARDAVTALMTRQRRHETEDLLI
ncbi:MAG: NAD(P)H-dependent glycerol-3-phosphate dehydrogenase [Clostridiales Family XIII bacterium]|jgi:glycerol-3-phosphate dehydrogenase (NAD(P)+)|nr:NAD(P)H-dependent glycerol-3-phosphate dehydrogenase [Clostridiales Family XIII bacterium]